MTHAHDNAADVEHDLINGDADDNRGWGLFALIAALAVFGAVFVYFWMHFVHAVDDKDARWARAADTVRMENAAPVALDAAKLADAMKSTVGAFATTRAAASAPPTPVAPEKPAKPTKASTPAKPAPQQKK